MTTIHICTGTNPRFLAQVRQTGRRIWTPVGRPHKSKHTAIMAMARAFSALPVKRGRVLHVADYYGPTLVAEMSR